MSPADLNNIRFDPARPGDYRFLRDSIAAYFAYDGIRFDESRVEAGLQALLATPSLGQAWVARVGGRPVGYAIIGFGFDLEFGGRQATLTDLYLEPGRRGQGLGKAFLEEIERFCAARGVGAIELQVEADNPEALALYASRGFVRHTRLPMSKRLV